MESLFDDLRNGLQEAISFAKGEGEARRQINVRAYMATVQRS